MGFYHVIGLYVALTLILFSGMALELGDKEGLRDVHRVDTNGERPSGVMWVVQFSDLHFSVFHTERAIALQKIMGTILGAIQPSLVLITGDLTDSKRSKNGIATQQYEEEWITYKDTMELISSESGIPLHLFYDLRGNHDKYGVPYANSPLDYYSRYSCNGHQNRTSLVQGITLLDNSGWKNLFVGFDDSMSVGLRGPSNLFGHPSDSVIAQVDRELSQWDSDTSERVTKIVFGHFPMSFTASSESGHRLEDIMTKHNISAYVCGHLHCKFGRQLYKHHQSKDLGEFWEWEMGDWRESRMMRILAIDHGRVSFVDVDFSQLSKNVLNGQGLEMPTIILPTSPLDSRVMLRNSVGRGQSDLGAIRVLVISISQPTSVTATVFDSQTQSFVDFVLVESLKLKLVSGSSTQGRSGGPFFYELLWDSQNYTASSPTRYWLQIQVLNNGVATMSSMWPFSVEGKKGPFTLKLLGQLAIGIDWNAMFPLILWTIIVVVFGGFLILPRLVYLYLERTGIYEGWSLSVLNTSASAWFPTLKLPLWALLEGARNRCLWWGEVMYVSFLILFPWFWGRVLADDYPIGFMTLRGWTVWPSKGDVSHQSGLGWPDHMGIVLPTMIAVVLPLVLIISALSAEQAACEIAAANAQHPERLLKKRTVGVSLQGTPVTSKFGFSLWRLLSGDESVGKETPLLENQDGNSKAAEDEPEISGEGGEVETTRRNWIHRGVRKVYFICCVALAFLHLKLCLMLASAYGAQSVFLSPIYVWSMPVLIVVSIYMTSSVKPRISHVD